MVLEEWTKRIATIKSVVERTMEHEFLHAFLGKSVVDEDRLFLLYSSLQYEAISENTKDIYITTAMLIDIALNIHDRVPNLVGASHLKQEQLRVLSGDYFSALYYKLLADVKDVSLIRSLASGIKIVNENKLNVYHATENMENFITSVKHIESAITYKFYAHFHPQKNTQHVESFLLLKRLLSERFHLQNNSKDSLLNLERMGSQDRFSVINKVDLYIEKLFDELLHIQWNTLNDTYMNDRVNELKGQFYSVKQEL